MRTRHTTRCGSAIDGSCSAIAALDLTSGEPERALPEAAAALADLAEAALEAALVIARTEVGEQADLCDFAVIGMGKTGGRELNYVSDVDVIFVAEPREGVDEASAIAAATGLATHLMRACSTTHGSGHAVAGRRGPAPGGQERPPGAHHRQPPRLLRALGQDLGVPGAAQGPPGRR